MRTIGPFVATDYSLFWAVEGRGRKSVTCDLRRPEGQDLFRRLASTADVVCENFRPGTMEEWGLGPDDLPAPGVRAHQRLRPGRPLRGAAGARPARRRLRRAPPPDRRARPTAGATRGDRRRLPHRRVRRRGGLAALYRRDTEREGDGDGAPSSTRRCTGRCCASWSGPWPATTVSGTVRQREGNRLSNSAPLDNYPTADGNYVCVVAGGDANFARLCAAMDRPDLVEDPRFATLAERAATATPSTGWWRSGRRA